MGLETGGGTDSMGKQKYNRIFIIVVDSLGVGALNDAPDYGDANTDTLGHISQNVGEFKIHHMPLSNLFLCKLI